MARSTPASSAGSRALAEQIRRLKERGFSEREIARQTELSKSFVHDILIGRRGVSTERATKATERLSREQSAYAVIDGQMRAVNPIGKRDRSKIGRHHCALQNARKAGDFRPIRRKFRNATIKTSEGEFQLETDPAVLSALDDAGLLSVDEVFHYEPTARAA